MSVPTRVVRSAGRHMHRIVAEKNYNCICFSNCFLIPDHKQQYIHWLVCQLLRKVW